MTSVALALSSYEVTPLKESHWGGQAGLAFGEAVLAILNHLHVP